MGNSAGARRETKVHCVAPRATLHPARRHVAVHRILPSLRHSAQEDHPMSSWVSTIELHLLVWHDYACTSGQHAAAIRHNCDIVVTLDLKRVSFERISLAAAALPRFISL